MTSKFSVLSVIAMIAIFALAVLSVSARPPAAPAKTSIAKQIAKIGTPITFAGSERVILNGTIKQIMTGTKMPLEELQRFDFKSAVVAKALDGHTGKREHVPIGRQRPQCPPQSNEASFY